MQQIGVRTIRGRPNSISGQYSLLAERELCPIYFLYIYVPCLSGIMEGYPNRPVTNDSMGSLDIKASGIDKYILGFGLHAWPLCELWGIYQMLYYSLCCHRVGPLDLVYIIYTLYIGDPLCRIFFVYCVVWAVTA